MAEKCRCYWEIASDFNGNPINEIPLSIQWTKLLGTKNFDVASSLTTGLDGSIYVSGRTEGDLDGQSNNGGYSDAFLTKFGT
jgi:hypothetical protein